MNQIDIDSIKDSDDAADAFAEQAHLVKDAIPKFFLLAELLIRMHRMHNDPNGVEKHVLVLIDAIEKLFGDSKAKLSKRLETTTLGEELFAAHEGAVTEELRERAIEFFNSNIRGTQYLKNKLGVKDE